MNSNDLQSSLVKDEPSFNVNMTTPITPDKAEISDEILINNVTNISEVNASTAIEKTQKDEKVNDVERAEQALLAADKLINETQDRMDDNTKNDSLMAKEEGEVAKKPEVVIEKPSEADEKTNKEAPYPDSEMKVAAKEDEKMDDTVVKQEEPLNPPKPSDSSVSSEILSVSDTSLVQENKPAAPMPLLGQRLKEAREAMNLTPESVYHNIKVHPRYIAAIEGHRWAEFPNSTYARGFIRNYAKLLGMTVEDEIHALFPPAPRVQDTQTHVEALHDPVVVFRSYKDPSHRLPFGVIGIGFAGLFFVVLIGAFFGDKLLHIMGMEELPAQVLSVVPTQNTEKEIAISTVSSLPLVDLMETKPSIAITVATPSVLGMETTIPSIVSKASSPSQMDNPTPSIWVGKGQITTPLQKTTAMNTLTALPSIRSNTATPSVMSSTKLPKAGVYEAGITNRNAPALLEVRVLETSWVSVQDTNGVERSSKLMNNGETFRYSTSLPFILVVGNATNALIRYDSKTVPTSSYLTENGNARLLFK